MPQPRMFRFAYNTPAREDRQLHPFQMRDGDAALYMTAALATRGFRYYGPIFNFASRRPVPRDPSVKPELEPVDTSFLRPNDLILLCGRPPMDDQVVGDRRRFPRSYTALEQTLFETLRKYLERCARSELILTDAAARLSSEIARRQSLEFRQNRGATYKSYGSPVTRQFVRFGQSHPLTAVFLLYTEHAWPGGPALLTAFGMGGTETLVWCYKLVTEFQHLLCSTEFAMAEMRIGERPERPMTMDFASSWEVTLLGTAPPKENAA